MNHPHSLIHQFTPTVIAISRLQSPLPIWMIYIFLRNSDQSPRYCTLRVRIHLGSAGRITACDHLHLHCGELLQLVRRLSFKPCLPALQSTTISITEAKIRGKLIGWWLRGNSSSTPSIDQPTYLSILAHKDEVYRRSSNVYKQLTITQHCTTIFLHAHGQG